MESYKAKTKNNDRAFVVIGFVVIGITFLLYSNIDDFSITDNSIAAIERLLPDLKKHDIDYKLRRLPSIGWMQSE